MIFEKICLSDFSHEASLVRIAEMIGAHRHVHVAAVHFTGSVDFYREPESGGDTWSARLWCADETHCPYCDSFDPIEHIDDECCPRRRAHRMKFQTFDVVQYVYIVHLAFEMENFIRCNAAGFGTNLLDIFRADDDDRKPEEQD